MTALDDALKLAQMREDKRMDFYHLFLRTELIVPLLENSNTPLGTRRTEKDEPVQLRVVEHEGKPILFVFDTVDRLIAYAQRPVKYVAVAAHALLPGLRPGLHLWLNAGTPSAKEFVPEEIAWLKGVIGNAGPQRSTIPQGTKVLISSPAQLPPELLERLTACLKKQREVQAAHLGQIHIAGAAEPELSIVIKTDQITEAAFGGISQEVGMAAQGVLGKRPLMILPYTGQNLDQAIVQATQPFYRRAG